MGVDADVLIAGGGLAAQRVCESLRRLGYAGRVRVLCGEPSAPYDRPPLSKSVLTGEREPVAPLLRPPAWYLDNEIELLLGARATRVDPGARSVALHDGSTLHYDHLVIATGSRPRRLPALPLGDCVRELRTIEDARALRELIAGPVERLVIVGAGLIAMEVASAAVSLGVAVTLIEAASAPLARALPPALGAWLVELHMRAGVEIALKRSVEHLRVRSGGVELTLSDGRVLFADLVLVATGSIADTRLLAAAGLGDGPLLTDRGGRTILPHVYAAGDVACFRDPASGMHLPTPHWEAAAVQGDAVARTIAGAAPKTPQPPMFWTDQYGVRIQFVGHAGQADRLELDGDSARPDFTAWLMAGERPVGALLAGRARALPAVRARIAAAAGAAQDEALTNAA